MRHSVPVVETLLQVIPQLRSQLFFKASLTALSHAMEDQVLAGTGNPLVIASFQQERFYRQEAHRYERIAGLTNQVYVLSAAGTSFENQADGYETIAFDADDVLTQEWNLVVLGEHYQSCLICRERDPAPSVLQSASGGIAPEQTRRFEGIWTQDPQVSQYAALILLDRILDYSPDLQDKVALAKRQYVDAEALTLQPEINTLEADPFTQRLVTYLQAGQYKLLKAYKAISIQERRERLINSITAVIRRSLDPGKIFQIAVDELGQALQACRCVVYRYHPAEMGVTIRYEYRHWEVASLVGTVWPLAENPLLNRAHRDRDTIVIPDTAEPDPQYADELMGLQALIEQWNIRSWLIVPLIHQQRLLGVIELHHCQSPPETWQEGDRALVEAVAAQLSVALIQADAYAHLQDLNQQLAALEQTRSNLIAITGHELRTPLSTIQVCLESLASEPDMPAVLQATMLSSALEDAERMRKLVQDFLTLSRLEGGQIQWDLEVLAIGECIDLALSSIQARYLSGGDCPKIRVDLPPKLPLIRADGEWVVEVIAKLLDNACKFTEVSGEIVISTQHIDESTLQVTIADNGRGIETYRLETVFDRFYQEEGALRRTAGGTGLGLAMCRQIIEGLKGRIWATSAGRDQGSQFHFTLPLAEQQPPPATKRRKSKASQKKT
ncbi:MAG: GAF domain-containing protein [Leptolyngbya sp. RL_3_1]|nr:GAF domain-containing protein [Leptolyngbya sp. RL_3_1]